jgi:hypothetical protein
MTAREQDRDNLDTLFREHGGLEGLARELGQHDPAAVLYDDANDNEPGGPAAMPGRREVILRYILFGLAAGPCIAAAIFVYSNYQQ